jgi:PAS domain-containing protein
MPRSGQTGLDLPLAISARALWLALALVLAVLFITDLRVPLGALDSIPYVLAVVLSLALPRGYEPVVVAASCTAITLISLFFAPEDASPRGPTFLHTGLPIFVVWATAWLAQRYRRAGQAVRAADAQIQLAALAAGFGTFDFDPIGGINHWSPGARRIVGLEDEPTVTFDRLLSVIHKDDLDRVLAGMRTGEDRVDPVNSRTSIASCDLTAPFGGCSSRAGRSLAERVRSCTPSTSRAWWSM